MKISETEGSDLKMRYDIEQISSDADEIDRMKIRLIQCRMDDRAQGKTRSEKAILNEIKKYAKKRYFRVREEGICADFSHPLNEIQAVNYLLINA